MVYRINKYSNIGGVCLLSTPNSMCKRFFVLFLSGLVLTSSTIALVYFASSFCVFWLFGSLSLVWWFRPSYIHVCCNFVLFSFSVLFVYSSLSFLSCSSFRVDDLYLLLVLSFVITCLFLLLKFVSTACSLCFLLSSWAVLFLACSIPFADHSISRIISFVVSWLLLGAPLLLSQHRSAVFSQANHGLRVWCADGQCCPLCVM